MGSAAPSLAHKGDWVITTMESASRAGRRAADAVLDGAGSRETPIKIFEPCRPPEWEPLKRIDGERQRGGEPQPPRRAARTRFSDRAASRAAA